MNPGPSAFGVLPVHLEKRSGPMSELLQPITCGQPHDRLKQCSAARHPAVLRAWRRRARIKVRQTAMRDSGGGASAEEPSAGRINDDVMKFLEPERVIVADPDQRETKQRRIVQRYRLAHLGPHPLLRCGERIVLFAEIKQPKDQMAPGRTAAVAAGRGFPRPSRATRSRIDRPAACLGS